MTCPSCKWASSSTDQTIWPACGQACKAKMMDQAYGDAKTLIAACPSDWSAARFMAAVAVAECLVELAAENEEKKKPDARRIKGPRPWCNPRGAH